VTAPAPIPRPAALLLAELLSYPEPRLPARTREACQALPAAAAAPALRCADALDALGPGGAEELYTATFELSAAVSPYVGEHLCGEGPRRNALLAWLAGLYAAAGHPCGAELPDHFAEVLRFLADAGERDEARELADLALRPAARRAAAALAPEHPYRAALDALLLSLGPDSGPEEAAP
jgi:nitrate reductase delta subunit